jgi:alpha-tubulin suppressor-like RCC1 family protein
MNLCSSYNSLANHFTFIADSGKLIHWGAKTGGNDIFFPEELSLGPEGSSVPLLSYAGGVAHCLALTKDGKLYAWGCNNFGQLGLGHESNQENPTLVDWQPSGSSKLKSVHSGAYFSSALTADGRLFMWGCNSDYQCGLGTAAPQPLPTEISFPSPVTHITCGYDFAMASTKSGEIFGWGRNSEGELGMPQTSHIPTPTLNEDLTEHKIKILACGGSHGLALAADGTLLGWGYNASRALGIDPKASQYKPVTILQKEDCKNFGGIVGICLGNSHSMVLGRDGTILIWGDGNFNQTGRGGTVYWPSVLSLHPTEEGPREGDPRDGKTTEEGEPKVVFIATGINNGIAMRADGKLFIWGMEGNGQLGLGMKRIYGDIPREITNFKFQLPSASSDELWDLVFQWIFLGNQDPRSIFSAIYVEIIFSFVNCFFV